MRRTPAQSSDVLLARLNHEVEKISALQHQLARKKAILQESLTRLRLGASPSGGPSRAEGSFRLGVGGAETAGH